MTVDPNRLVEVLKDRGVVRGKLLTRGDRDKIAKLEAEYSRRVTLLGRPLNLGVRECLKKRFICVLLTAPSFKWPDTPHAIIRVDYTVIGYIDRTGLHLHRFKLQGLQGERIVVYPPTRLPELDRVVKNHLVSFPSPPTHAYLAGKLNAESEEYGTMIVGFQDFYRTYIR